MPLCMIHTARYQSSTLQSLRPCLPTPYLWQPTAQCISPPHPFTKSGRGSVPTTAQYSTPPLAMPMSRAATADLTYDTVVDRRHSHTQPVSIAPWKSPCTSVCLSEHHQPTSPITEHTCYKPITAAYSINNNARRRCSSAHHSWHQDYIGAT
jgi:hypothetical protein